MSVTIIGIGASAGGVQALESFFSEIPPDLDAAFVVVQHLSPDYDSSMPEILQRCTSLKVVSLEKETPPRPGVVYVKSPTVEVEVTDQMLKVRPRHKVTDGPYLPIDDFFLSLATARGQDAIAVVLSGMGTDGSRGVRTIKEHGGIVLVQDPDTAEFDGMPRSTIRQHMADVILPPAQLASKAAAIVRKFMPAADVERQLSDLNQQELVNTLLSRIRETVRIDFTRYRQSTIQRRIQKRMLISQIDELLPYVRFALGDDDELRVLRESFLIGVTRFFRDPEAFDHLRREVISRLFDPRQNAPAPDGKISRRIWVPACSTGEEVYTIAILIEDYLETNNIKAEYKIFGSDVDRKSVLKATRGEYDETIAADVPAEHLMRYFTPRSQGGYRVRSEVRERVLFAVQNLLDDPPFIHIDLLTCRNFLIYVKNKTQQRILANFHFGLTPTGFLMLGPSETLDGLRKVFSVVDRRWKIYRKNSDRHDRTSVNSNILPRIDQLSIADRRGVTFVNHSPYSSPNHPSVGAEDQRPAVARGEPLTTRSLKEPVDNMDYFARHLSERYAPATLFVNQRYDILYLNGNLADILHLPRFNARLNLQTVVADEAESVLISGVDRAFKTRQSGRFDKVNLAASGNDPHLMRVRFSPVEFAELDEPLVSIEFFTPQERPLGQGDADEDEVYSVDPRLRDRIKELELELQRSELRAQKLYNELDATNEELQSSNRELLASNEELQSTNEELQSVNEELYTVNNEFQRKIEELNNVNNDIKNLLKSIQISTIFVDSELRIRRFTPGSGRQFDLNANDVGRSITTFSNPFPDLDIESICHEVLTTQNRFAREIPDQNGEYYLVRMLPYLAEEEEVEGVVITFLTITDVVKTRRELAGMAVRYKAIFAHSQETIAVISENSRIGSINLSLAGYGVEELNGSYFSDLIATDAEKVRFNEAIRGVFDEQSPTKCNLSLSGKTPEATVYAEVELIPVVPDKDQPDYQLIHDSRQWAMIIVHDVTHTEKARR